MSFITLVCSEKNKLAESDAKLGKKTKADHKDEKKEDGEEEESREIGVKEMEDVKRDKPEKEGEDR